MSFSHLLILGIIAVIVIPPDKLPEVARQVARFLGEMRRMSSGIFDDLNKQDPQLKPEDNLKRQQQREQEFAVQQEAQQPEQSQQELFQEPATPLQTLPPEQTPEQIKKAEEDYLKHIQGETVTIAEEKKTKDE